MMQPFDPTPTPESRPGEHAEPSIGRQRGSRVPVILQSGPTPANLLRCLQRRLVQAVGIGLVLAVVSAACAWHFAPLAKHQVRTLVRVPPQKFYIMQTGEYFQEQGNYQRTQVAFVKSRMVLGAAVLEPKVAELGFIKDMVDPVEWLENQVQVDFSVAPEIMKVSMRGMNTDDLTAIVNGVVNAYLLQVVDRENLTRRDRKARIAELLANYELQLRTTRENQRNLVKQMNVGGSDKELRAKTQGFMQTRLITMENQLLRSQTSRLDAQGRLQQLKAEKQLLEADKASEAAITAAIADAFENLPDVLAYRAVIRDVEGKLAKTMERATKGEGDLSVKALRKEIDSHKNKLKEMEKQERPALVKAAKAKMLADVQQKMRVEQSQIEAMKHTEALVEPDIKMLREQLTKANEKGMDLDTMQTDLTHLENMVYKLRAEQEAVNVELQAPKRVEVIEFATVTKVDPFARKILFTVGAAIGGMCFALLGIAFLEYRTRRVDSVDEVVLGLGMRLVGTVPNAKNQAKSAKSKDPAAQQVLTESVDAARTMLLHLARTHSLRTVMVTSAVAGEGKTSLSCHLAASLARAGLRMLLIDGDMRNPTAHRLFGMSCEQGFSEVLTGKLDANAAVKATSLRGLYLMPAGTWNDQTALSISQGKVASTLEELRQQFDLIIIDSSPVLPVADGLMIGQQVDGVLLSVLCQVSRLTNLYAAWQRIEDLGVRPLGVVINGVRASLYGSSYNYPYPRKKKSPPVQPKVPQKPTTPTNPTTPKT